MHYIDKNVNLEVINMLINNILKNLFGEKFKTALHSKPKHRRKKIFSKSKFFELSPSTINLFLECEKCFYLHCKYGLRKPQNAAYTLNLTVDELLKKEFEKYSLNRDSRHPYFIEEKLNFYPEKLEIKKLRYELPNSNLIITGKVDAIWKDADTDEYIIADYKATSKIETITKDSSIPLSFQKQLEVYQWLYEKLKHPTSKTAYIVYCNAKKNMPNFNNRLMFEATLVPHSVKSDWIQPALNRINDILNQNALPEEKNDCSFCNYYSNRSKTI